MKIYGLQKLTLLDFPEKTACTLFTKGCNFRCPYCHNSSLVLEDKAASPIDEGELFAFLEKRRGVLEGICISGGEPLLHEGLEEFILRLKKMNYLVKIDTNGSFPQGLKSLCEKNLVDYVAMDVKAPFEKYPLLCGAENVNTDAVKESISFLISGKTDYEFRTTAVKNLHSQEDIINIAQNLKGAKRYFLQGFVGSENVIGGACQPFSKEEMSGFLSLVRKYLPNAELRGI